MSRFTFLTGFLLFLATAAFPAEGLRTLPDTAEAMGAIGGRLTLLDDASVVRTNPATLTDIEDSTLTVTFQPWHGKTTHTTLTGVSQKMVQSWKPLGSLYYATPINDTLSAGLGISAPFGTAINWPREGPFRYSGAYDATLKTLAINPALGLKLNDKVSIGVGVDVYQSTLTLEQRYPWFLVTGNPASRDGEAIFDARGWGVGGYMGINIDLNDRHRLAITGRLPVSVDYDGDFDISNIPAPGIALPRTDFTSEIEHAGSVAIGYGIDVTDKLSIGFDFEWIGNSSHDDVPLNIGANQPLLGGATALPVGWDDSISFGFGTEYQLLDNLVLRAGYLYSDSPGNSRTYNPSVPSDDRHIFSVGLGYSWGDGHTIDLAYSLLTMDSSDIRGNVVPAYDGHYDYDWDILSISYTRRFRTTPFEGIMK